MKVKVLLEHSEDGGYTVTVPELPGCISEGDTKEDAIEIYPFQSKEFDLIIEQ